MKAVDASIVFKWFNESEEQSEQALVLLDAHLTKSDPILAPDILFYEVANALTMKSSLKASKIKESLMILRDYSLTTVKPESDLLIKASILTRQYKVSVYDAVYAVLAKEKGCDLITADKIFVLKVKLPYVKLLGG